MSGKNYSAYFTLELVEKFERVQEHLGKGVSQSFAHLVEAKDLEIRDGLTRRDQVAAAREDIAELKQQLARIELLLQEMIGHDTDHA